MSRALWLLILCVAAAPPAARTAEDSPDLARLGRAAAAHPDDPDLTLAYASALEAAGRPGDAASVIAAVEARWPDHRPGLALRRGRLLYDAGLDAEALRALDAALAADPASATAHLYRGLVLRRLGRSVEADDELVEAGELEPDLRSEALLLRGLERMGRGDDDEGELLLREAIAIDPAGEAARRSRLLIPSRPALVDGPWISLGVHAGTEWDSNVTLDSGVDTSGNGNQSDWGGILGGDIVLRPWSNETAGVMLGYHFDTGLHNQVTDYDYQTQQGFASLLFRAAEQVTLRLDGVYNYGKLGGTPYVQVGTVRPNVFYAWSDDAGVSRLFGEVHWSKFYEDNFLESLNRSGTSYGVGLEHTLPVPGFPMVLATLHARWANQDTASGADFLGFDSAYAFDRSEAGLELRFPVIWGIRGSAGAMIGWEPYDNTNVIDFLTDDGFGDPTPNTRRDLVTDASVTLQRELYRGVTLEVAWRYTSRDSNVDLYTYDRNVVGMYLRFQTP